MQIQDLERLAGIILTIGVVVLIILLCGREFSGLVILPIIIILVGSFLLEKVKIRQKVILKAKEQSTIRVFYMVRSDMPEVIKIEQESSEFPWNQEGFLQCARQHNHPCVMMVAELNKKVVGFMVFETKEFHILKFVVHPNYRRIGVGTQMMKSLIDKLYEHRRPQTTIEVRERNVSAQLFLRRQGFLMVETLKNCYDDSPEDCYVMMYKMENRNPWA